MRLRSLGPAALAVLAASGRPSIAHAEPEAFPAAASVVDPAEAKLRALFEPGRGPLRAPTSPRFVSVREPGRQGSRLLLGWVLPGLSADERAELATVTTLLAENDFGRIKKRVSALGPGITVEVALAELEQAPLLIVSLDSPRSNSTKELELSVLETLAALAADETSGVTALVRRYLAPLSRAVVEVHPPERAVAVGVVKPMRHVIERGDTLSEIAASHGLDLDTLVRLNGVDPKKAIHPGQELKLNEGSAPRPKLYVSKQGDTLAKVARHFGVSEKALVDVNRMEPGHLSPGQKLVLPR
jgi:LysM repeat protein